MIPGNGPQGGADRPGRIVIGTLGLDQHEVGAIAISQLLQRRGFEVIYLGRFNTPATLAAAAEQEDADLVGVSVHSWELTAYVDELVARCRELGVGLVVGGSVLTEGDRAELHRRGVEAVFGAYASANEMLDQIQAIVERVRAGEPPARLDVTAKPAGSDPAALAGRVVAITGAGHGLGRAYALALCHMGAAVIANDVDQPALQEVATLLQGASGSVELVAGDITDPATPSALLNAALSRYGQLHALVSNAGVLRSGPILRLDDKDLALLLDLHVAANFRLLRTIGNYWRREVKAGRAIDSTVVLTTSSAGLYGFRAEAAYSATKAAVAALVVVAADELGRYGTTVNAIAPAALTRLTGWMGKDADNPGDNPLAPDHVAPVLAWLLGPAARQVTGRVLEAGNGWISAPRSWQPGRQFRLPPMMTVDQARELLPRVLASTPPPPPVLTATVTPNAAS